MKRNKSIPESEMSALGEDPKALEAHIKQALYGHQRLLSPNDTLTGMLQKIINSAIEGEMTNHLDESKASGLSNRRNGKLTKPYARLCRITRNRTPVRKIFKPTVGSTYQHDFS